MRDRASSHGDPLGGVGEFGSDKGFRPSQAETFFRSAEFQALVDRSTGPNPLCRRDFYLDRVRAMHLNFRKKHDR